MWLYNNEPLTAPPEKAICFHNLNTKNKNKKKYMRKKVIHFQKTTQKNLKKKKVKVESDWKTYTGSNDDLNSDIETNNPELKQEILEICYSKSSLSYIEAYHQFINNALIDSSYYNNWISVRVTRRHLTKYKIMLDESNSI